MWSQMTRRIRVAFLTLLACSLPTGLMAATLDYNSNYQAQGACANIPTDGNTCFGAQCRPCEGFADEGLSNKKDLKTCVGDPQCGLQIAEPSFQNGSPIAETDDCRNEFDWKLDGKENTMAVSKTGKPCQVGESAEKHTWIVINPPECRQGMTLIFIRGETRKCIRSELLREIEDPNE